MTGSRDLSDSVVSPQGPRRWWTAAAAGAVAVLAGVLLVTASWSTIDLPWNDDDLPDDAIMRVGDRVVTAPELDTRLASLEALYGVVPPDDPESLAGFKQDAAKSLAVSLVIENAAAERGIVVSEKQAQAELAKIISDQLGGDRQAFVKYLGSVGLSESQVIDEIKRTLVNQRLYEDVTEAVPAATQAEARAEYDSRRSDMREPERRRISNIVVASREDAEAALDRLEAGETFLAVAREVTLDQQTRSTGGDLGLLPEAQLDPAFGAAAFSTARGELFGPVESQYGWNVGKVQAVVPGKALSFEEVEETLLQSLTTKAALEVWRGFMREALDDADIVYADEYRPDDPDSLPSDVVSNQQEVPTP